MKSRKVLTNVKIYAIMLSTRWDSTVIPVKTGIQNPYRESKSKLVRHRPKRGAQEKENDSSDYCAWHGFGHRSWFVDGKGCYSSVMKELRKQWRVISVTRNEGSCRVVLQQEIEGDSWNKRELTLKADIECPELKHYYQLEPGMTVVFREQENWIKGLSASINAFYYLVPYISWVPG